MLMNAFFDSQFSRCPLIWMIHRLHYRALRMIYQDDTASFEERLERNGNFTIHHRNLQSLAIEMYKAAKDIPPTLLKGIFRDNKNLGSVSSGTPSHSCFYNHVNPKNVNTGLQRLRCIGPKIWDLVPQDVKDADSLPIFKNKIRHWKPPLKSPCRLCLEFIPNLGFI